MSEVRSLGGGRVKTTSKTARYIGGIGKSKIISSGGGSGGGGSTPIATKTRLEGGGTQTVTAGGKVTIRDVKGKIVRVYQGEPSAVQTHLMSAKKSTEEFIKAKREPIIAVDVAGIKEFNRIMRERGVSASTYLKALKGEQQAILKVTGEAQAREKFEAIREAEKTSFERAVEKQEARDVQAYKRREKFKDFLGHYIKGESWLAKAGREVLMLPYDFSVGFTAPASAGEKIYLMGRGAVTKGVGVKAVGKEFVKAGKKTPKVLAETFDVRKPEGAVALATVVGFTVLGGKAIKVARVRGVGVKVKAPKVKTPEKVGKGFYTRIRKVSDYLDITKKGKVYPVEKGFKVPRKTQVVWKEFDKGVEVGKKVTKVGQVKYFGKKGRMQTLEKVGLRKPKIDKLIKSKARPSKIEGRIARLEERGSLLKPKSASKRFRQIVRQQIKEHKQVVTPKAVLEKRALVQVKKPFGSKTYRKAIRTQIRVKEGLRPRYEMGKRLYYYDIAKEQIVIPKKTSFLKKFLGSKKGQTQLLKYKLKTKPVGVEILSPKASLFIPPTSLLAGGVIKPRKDILGISKTKAKTILIPKFKVSQIPQTKIGIIQDITPKLATSQIPLLKQKISTGLGFALGTTALGAYTFKDLLKREVFKFDFDWPGGGGGRGGRLFGWRYGIKIHKMNLKKLLGV